MIVASTFVRLIGAAAVTICPIIFVEPGLTETERRRVLIHEWIHNRQQFGFGFAGAMIGVFVWMVLSWPLQPSSAVVIVLGILEGWVAGQLFWRFLYLCCLPVRWNWFRRHWETEAFEAEGMAPEEIAEILKKPPYYLS